MSGVGIVFLAVAVGVLAFLSIAVFFIIFGIMKKMKGFVIAGAALLILFVAFFVMTFLMNLVAIK
ncbi:MAG: hypothetical protein J6C01_05060 [Lachnospiraceae bacterium]|nr:hypothetical protein [Lachnospiraceae bacterium]